MAIVPPLVTQLDLPFLSVVARLLEMTTDTSTGLPDASKAAQRDGPLLSAEDYLTSRERRLESRYSSLGDPFATLHREAGQRLQEM